MNEYHRTIVDFLRGHGARDVRLVPGGRHPHVTFTFRDKGFNLAVHGNLPGHTDAAIIKVRELQKMLGEPDVAAPREPRRLDDMTPRANGLAPPVMMGNAAMYSGKGQKMRLRLFPPVDVVETLGDGAIRVERMAHDTWLLSRGAGTKPAFRVDGKKHQLDAGYAEELTRGYPTPFGASPAEYVAVDGKVMVRLLVDRIKPVEVRRPKGSKIGKSGYPLWMENTAAEAIQVRDVEPKMGASVATLAAGADEQRTASGARWVEPTMPDPRAVLAAISKIETATPYRLVRLKDSGAWAWQAPTIRLEDKT